MPASRPSAGVRVLGEALRVYRIGDPQGAYPIYSGEGAARIEGRWHEKGQEVIYTSRHYSTALLEKLAHQNRERLVDFLPNPRAAISAADRLGTMPLVVATGAGAGARVAIGATVVFGMLAATAVGIFFVPALYAALEHLAEWRWGRAGRAGAPGERAG